jgi:hypothetical protein
MQTRNDRCAPCYGRRAVLGLAFAPFIDRPSALATSRLIRYAPAFASRRCQHQVGRTGLARTLGTRHRAPGGRSARAPYTSWMTITAGPVPPVSRGGSRPVQQGDVALRSRRCPNPLPCLHLSSFLSEPACTVRRAACPQGYRLGAHRAYDRATVKPLKRT